MGMIHQTEEVFIRVARILLISHIIHFAYLIMIRKNYLKGLEFVFLALSLSVTGQTSDQFGGTFKIEVVDSLCTYE